MELLPRSAFPRDLPAVPGPGRHGDGRDRGTAQGWRSGCPLAVAAVTAVTLQRRCRCRAFRTVRAAELHGANQDEHTFDSMLEHLRCQNPSMDPIQREGDYVNGLVCPWCNGGFKREKNFSARYKNGTLWCRCWRMNKCGRTATYHRKGRDFWRPAPPRATPSKPKEVKEVLLGQNMIELTEEHQEWFRNRGISKETLERNRICSKQTKNGKAAIVFPYYEGEKLVAEKLRALPKTFWQTPGGQKSLYGVDDVKDQKEVVITEGEIDKLSFDEAGISWSASLQNGASAGFDGANGRAVELLASAERVVLAVDGDAAGQECAAKLAEQLNWRRCYMVKWPAGCKDANEVLLKHGKDALRKLTEDAQLIPCPWEMRLITEETSRLVQQKINGTLPAEMVYGVKTGWDSLDHLWRPVLGEVTVVTGVPGHGKSEFLLSLAVNLGHLHNYKTLLFAFESTSRYLATQLYLKATGTCPSLEQRDDQDVQYRESLKWVDDHIIVECDFQSDEDLTVDGILEKAKEEAAKGMKCLIIDPYNFIDRSKEEAKTLEHHYIGNILQRLRKFAEDLGVHVIIVAHPTKASSWDGQKPTLYTIAGSSNWFNKTDNGLVIYRREIDDGAGGTVPTNQLEIVVEKVRNREAGQLGRTMLCFDFESRCYSDLSQQDAWTLDAPEPSRLESVSRIGVPCYAAMDDEDDEY